MTDQERIKKLEEKTEILEKKIEVLGKEIIRLKNEKAIKESCLVKKYAEEIKE